MRASVFSSLYLNSPETARGGKIKHWNTEQDRLKTKRWFHLNPVQVARLELVQDIDKSV